MTDTTNTTNTNPLDPVNFYTQNVHWVSDSAQLLKTKDISELHRTIARRAMTARAEQYKLNKKEELTQDEREERARLHQTLQVLVPALRRSTTLLRNLADKNANEQSVHAAASRLAVFLLGMVAQSSLFPAEARLQSIGARFDADLPGGLTLVNRSVALNVLRDHAELFGACPAWVELVVVHPTHMSADSAIKDRGYREQHIARIGLRNKIINLGVLSADEEQLLMRLL